MAVRWECPSGKHPGVLGSERPRKNSVVRYCLRCSEDTGVLVERTAPALERKRAAKTASSAEREKAKRVREREREAKRYIVTSVDGETLDLRAEMEVIFRTPEVRARAKQDGRSGRWRPTLGVHRRRDSYVTGRAWPFEDRIHLSVGNALAASIRETLLHEVVHAVLPHDEWHGSIFRAALCRAARELWGTTVHPDDHREAYGLDRLIVEQVREAARARPLDDVG